MMHPQPHMYPCGDHAITVEFGDAINRRTNENILSLFQYIRQNPPDGLRDVIPAYHTLTLVYDPVTLKREDPSVSAYEKMSLYLEKIIEHATQEKQATKLIEIPVCYDLSLAPDLVSLAAMHMLPVEEVIRLHTSVPYHVYLVGFLPGFAYMGSVDEKIRTPRLAAPRVQVPAGSVGIAGEQTGVYPFESPGGWQLIGQTPVKMFDATRTVPCYVQPGNEVRFYPIKLEEFNKMKNA